MYVCDTSIHFDQWKNIIHYKSFMILNARMTTLDAHTWWNVVMRAKQDTKIYNSLILCHFVRWFSNSNPLYQIRVNCTIARFWIKHFHTNIARWAEVLPHSYFVYPLSHLENLSPPVLLPRFIGSILPFLLSFLIMSMLISPTFLPCTQHCISRLDLHPHHEIYVVLLKLEHSSWFPAWCS